MSKKFSKILGASRRAQVEQLLGRSKGLTLFGVAPDGRPWNEFCSASLQELLDWDLDPDWDPAKVGKTYERAHKGDLDAQHELQALRIDQTQNYVIPALNFGTFFEVVILAENESPAIQNNTMNEFKVRYLGQDGGWETKKVTKAQTEVLIDLRELTTDRVEYVTRDLYSGRRIGEAAQATFNLAFDFENKLDGLLYTLLDQQIGSFDLTNADKSQRVVNRNSRILSTVIPTTNDVVLTGNSGSTLLRLDAFTETVDYCARHGKDTLGIMEPTGEVYVPAEDCKEIASGITFTGAKQSELAERITRNGWMEIGEFMGRSWKLIPDATIARKKCYPKLNRPVGKLYFKPSLDIEVEEVDKIKHLASRVLQKVVAMAVPTTWKKHALRVTYRS